MPNSWPLVRRNIAQRMNMWGGDLASNGPGRLSADSPDIASGLPITHLVDNTRPEGDEEWDDAWIVLNPGATGDPNLATIWRRIASEQGWTLSNSTFTLNSAIPSAYAHSGMTYELFKSFRPEQWLQAANWAISNSYPNRHRRIWFEIPEDINQQEIDWLNLAKEQLVIAPTSAPAATASNYLAQSPPAGFAAGTYKVAYTYVNPNGESILSPATTLTLLAGQTIDFPALTVPDGVTEVRYYGTIIPGGTTFFMWNTGSAKGAQGSIQPLRKGLPDNTGTVPELIFIGPPPASGSAPPSFNQSQYDIIDLLKIQRRYNPGQWPEILQDLPHDMYESYGQGTIRLNYVPIGQFNLRFICIGLAPIFANEPDVSSEPLELLVSGAEYFLWDILMKSAAGQNQAAWAKLSEESLKKFNLIKNRFTLERPNKQYRRPMIKVVW